jgi:hypothetical protein
MKRSFDNSIQHARSKYLPTVTEESHIVNNKTNNIIEGMMGDMVKSAKGNLRRAVSDPVGSMKKGLGKLAGAANKINSFAQNQKHGGTFGAMNSAGAFDPKGDSQQVRAEWDKLDAGAKQAWETKGNTFTPPQEGADYFYNQRMEDLAKKKTDSVGSQISNGSNSGTQTQQTPAEQEQAWRDAFLRNPAIRQFAQSKGMDEQGYVDFKKAESQ